MIKRPIGRYIFAQIFAQKLCLRKKCRKKVQLTICATVKLLCFCNTLPLQFLQVTYFTSGLDLKKLANMDTPKVYLYGKYKAVVSIENVENKGVGCVAAELTLIRPWKTQI